MNTKKWIENNIQNLNGKTIAITGATGGIGKELCTQLLAEQAHLILLCRNKNLTESFIFTLKQKFENAKIDFIELDFSNLESVNKCILQLQKYNGIDVLIHNAGVYNVPLKTLDSGFNNIFQINFLYPYYLTKKLMCELEKKENSTCVVVSSIAHNYSKLDRNDIDFSSRKKPSKIYGNAKRFLTFSMFELFEGSKVNLSVVHPGITLTNMTNHYPKLINPIVKLGIKLLFPSPKQAVLNLAYGLKQPTAYHEWIGPKIFNVWGKPTLKKLKTASHFESEEIFKIAEQLCSNIK